VTAKPARTDGERLDWVQRRYGDRRWNGHSLGEDFLDLMTYHEGGHMLWDDVREAIDAAIQAEESQDD